MFISVHICANFVCLGVLFFHHFKLFLRRWLLGGWGWGLLFDFFLMGVGLNLELYIIIQMEVHFL